MNYFPAAAREQSISGEAVSLRLFRSTLSRQLKEMEEELGKKHHLFLLTILKCRGILIKNIGYIGYTIKIQASFILLMIMGIELVL